MPAASVLLRVAFACLAGAATAAGAQGGGAAREGTRYGTRADVVAFAREVAADTGLDRERVERWLAAPQDAVAVA